MVKDLLERGKPYYLFEKFGNAKPLPTNSTKRMQWRRYFLKGTAFTDSKYNPYEYYEDSDERFDVAGTNTAGTSGGAAEHGRKLTEGTTPTAIDLDSADIHVDVVQYGMWTQITDVIADLHEDPVLQEAIDVLGEAGAFLTEKIYYNALIAGSNVYYSAGTSRAEVNKPISLRLQRLVTRGLKRNLGNPITKVVTSNPNFGTEPISPSYVAVAHPDLESDIRNMTGFVPAEKYGTMTPWEGEIGKVESVRYLLSTVASSLGATGEVGTAEPIMKDGAGRGIVYPILYFAANAYALVPVKGKNSIVPMVLNPNTPRGEDPLGQRGSVGIKFYTACVILHDYWMARVEVAASDLTEEI